MHRKLQEDELYRKNRKSVVLIWLLPDLPAMERQTSCSEDARI